jgi:hypothetical protein
MMQDDTALRICFASLLLVSVITHFTCIILVSLYTSAARATARSADLWRLFCATGHIPSVIDTLFTIGNFTLSGCFAFTMLPVYSLVTSIIFSAVVVLVCGVAMHFVHSKQFLPRAHVVHGWKKMLPTEYVTSISLVYLETLAVFDAEM